MFRTLALAAALFAGATSTAEARAIPGLDRLDLSRAHVRALAPGETLTPRGGCYYSDLHVYSARTGRPYRQAVDRRADGYVFTRRGRGGRRVIVAGWDREDGRWHSFAHREAVIVVNFCEDTN